MSQLRKTGSLVLSLALAGALSAGSVGVALAQDADTESTSTLAGAVASMFAAEGSEVAEAANPFGIYDPATGSYTNAYFGFTYQLGDGWEVQGHDAASAETDLQLLNQKMSMIDLMAINDQTYEVLLTQVIYNGDHEVIDRAAVESNVDLFMDGLVGSMGVNGEVTDSAVVTVKFGGQDVPVIMYGGVIDANGTQLDFYAQTAFISKGDYVLTVSAITYGEDNTAALLNAYQPYDSGALAGAAAAAQMAGVWDKASGQISNGYFGYKAELGSDWAITAASAGEVAALDAALQSDGAVVDLLAQNSVDGSEIISLIVANELGGPVDEEFVETYALGSIGAFLSAAGLVPDEEFSAITPALMAAVQAHSADLAKSPFASATAIKVVDASLEPVAKIAGQDVLIMQLECLASIDGAEVPVYVGIAIVPDETASYVNLISVISYEQDQTAELFGMFEAE